MRGPSLLPAWLGLVLALSACTTSAIPDPKDAVKAYADAAAKGDASAIYGMMSEKSRRSLSEGEVKRVVADERAELADQAKALSSPGIVVKARARVRYADGEDASLELEQGGFRITAADALPAGARTPAQALEQLRRVLARRSYAGLMRVLSPTTRAAIESDCARWSTGSRGPRGSRSTSRETTRPCRCPEGTR